MLKAISYSLTAEKIPVDDTTVSPEDEYIEEGKEAEISEDELTGRLYQHKIRIRLKLTTRIYGLSLIE